MFYAKRQYQPLGEQCNPSYAFSLGAPGRTALPDLLIMNRRQFISTTTELTLASGVQPQRSGTDCPT